MRAVRSNITTEGAPYIWCRPPRHADSVSVEVRMNSLPPGRIIPKPPSVPDRLPGSNLGWRPFVNEAIKPQEAANWDLYRALRDQWTHEDNLANHRVMWLTLAQGLLLTAYGSISAHRKFLLI